MNSEVCLSILQKKNDSGGSGSSETTFLKHIRPIEKESEKSPNCDTPVCNDAIAIRVKRRHKTRNYIRDLKKPKLQLSRSENSI